MTKSPVIIYESSSLENAWNLLKKESFQHLPVLDDNGNIAGMLSSTDIENFSLWVENAINDPGTILKNLVVRDIMTTKVISIRKNDAIEMANDLLLSNSIRALPVIDNGRIIGIISETDILRYYNDKYSK